MQSLERKLRQKTYGPEDARKTISESTVQQYIKALTKLHDGKPFSNLAWARKYNDIQAIIDTYAPSTRQTMYGILASVFSVFSDTVSNKKAYTHWSNKIKEQKKEAPATEEKTETQEQNWIEWTDVEAKKREISEIVESYADTKKLTPAEYDFLLQYLMLHLYTDIAPRRNLDYSMMVLVNKLPKEQDPQKNYYVISGVDAGKFIFNRYKTDKKFGQQVIEAPEELRDAITKYLKHYPVKRSKGGEYPFIVRFDGEELNPSNGITRILNRAFARNVAASMLRHIYLTHKFGADYAKRKEVAEDIAHSFGTQSEYIKE